MFVVNISEEFSWWPGTDWMDKWCN